MFSYQTGQRTQAIESACRNFLLRRECVQRKMTLRNWEALSWNHAWSSILRTSKKGKSNHMHTVAPYQKRYQSIWDWWLISHDLHCDMWSISFLKSNSCECLGSKGTPTGMRKTWNDKGFKSLHKPLRLPIQKNWWPVVEIKVHTPLPF